ncbi:hypothetical protein EXIGLDRAFT_769051, partial [Exidia glandulosa HHB12029]
MASTPQPLPPLRRVVTCHKGDSARSVVRDDSGIEPKARASTGAGPRFGTIWTVDKPQYELNDERDLAAEGYEADKTALSDGSRLSVVDLPPGAISPLHRTVSLDYGIVLKGTVVMHLDDGSTTKVEE